MPSLSFHSAGSDSEFVDLSLKILTDSISDSIVRHGRCVLGLSGGSTPKPIYEALGKSKSIEWQKIWLFLVDERLVPPSDPKSNQFLLRSTLLKNAAIPESQIVFPDAALSPDECARSYGARLSDLFGEGPPDVLTLGMGEDGHVASLFPPLLPDAFGPRLAISTTTDRFPIRNRVGLTMTALSSAGHVLFFLKGDEKRQVWETMQGSDDEMLWPAKIVLRKVQADVIARW